MSARDGISTWEGGVEGDWPRLLSKSHETDPAGIRGIGVGWDQGYKGRDGGSRICDWIPGRGWIPGAAQLARRVCGSAPTHARCCSLQLRTLARWTVSLAVERSCLQGSMGWGRVGGGVWWDVVCVWVYVWVYVWVSVCLYVWVKYGGGRDGGGGSDCGGGGDDGNEVLEVGEVGGGWWGAQCS